MKTLALLPRNAVAAFLITYRSVVSPFYGDVCRYAPSCSLYGLQAVQQHGAVRGAWLAVRRLLRCHPWARGGIDDIPEPSRRLQTTGAGFSLAHKER